MAITRLDRSEFISSSSPKTLDLFVADGSCLQIRQLLSTAQVPVLWLDGQEPPLKTVSRALAKQKLLMQPVATLHWVSHGTPGRLHIGATQINSNSYSATGLDLSSLTDGTLTITADVSDLAGNAATQATDTSSKDCTAPTVAVSSDVNSLKAGETAALTFTLSESSTTFAADDLTISGGILSNFSGSGASYSATFTPSTNSTTDGVISVASSKFSDASGNTNADGSDSNNSVTVSVDTRVSSPAPSPTPTPSPSPTPSPTPTPSPSSTPEPSPTPTSSPSPTPEPAANPQLEPSGDLLSLNIDCAISTSQTSDGLKIMGSRCSDVLVAQRTNDILHGKDGVDRHIGKRGDDLIRGGKGSDTLLGRHGRDRLRGGNHKDRLHGGKGDDTLIGGSGADRFRLSKGSDAIKDFSIKDGDQLLISNAIELTIEQVGKHLLLTDADKGISTTLKAVALDDLLAHQPELLG